MTYYIISYYVMLCYVITLYYLFMLLFVYLFVCWIVYFKYMLFHVDCSCCMLCVIICMFNILRSYLEIVIGSIAAFFYIRFFCDPLLQMVTLPSSSTAKGCNAIFLCNAILYIVFAFDWSPTRGPWYQWNCFTWSLKRAARIRISQASSNNSLQKKSQCKLLSSRIAM